MSLSKEDVEQIVEIMNNKSLLTHDEHSHHHDFIEAMIKKEERKQETWQKVKVHVLGWGAIGIIGSIGTWILKHIEW